MRMLELNQTPMWYVNKIGEVEVIDEEGNFTGELESVFSEPIKISLHLYPATGSVLKNTFGLSANLDYVTGTSVKLEQDTLLYYEEPKDKFEETYDFTISKILKSLNIYQYGLKGRR